MHITYETLDLRIKQYGKKTLIEALGSQGEWVESNISIPYDELSRLHEQLSRNVSNSLSMRSLENRSALDKLGNSLGDALFTGPVLQLYTAMLQRILSHPDKGIRIKLSFFGDGRQFQALPWEALRVNGQSLAIDPRQIIVRSVNSINPMASPIADKLPIRMLVVYSAPCSDVPLNFDQEAKEINNALLSLINHGLLQMQIYRNPTIAQIEKNLRQEDFHIFHFVGHGGKNANGDGVLVFVDSEEMRFEIDGRYLAGVLCGTTIKMVFLNTEGAYGYGLGVGVAEALLEVGIPYIVTHSSAITDDASILFSSAFYEELAKRNSPEYALFAGRRAIMQLPNSFAFQVSPVLFTRTIGDKFWTGDAGAKIEILGNKKKSVTDALEHRFFDTDILTDQIETQIIRDDKKNVEVEQVSIKYRENDSPDREGTKRTEESGKLPIELTSTVQKKERNEMERPIKILFLAANPKDTSQIRLDEEMRGIDQTLRQAEFRDKFDIKQQWAVRVLDLQGYLLRHNPDIVHFSGHGSASNEIILEDNTGNSQSVSVSALSNLFSVLKDNIRCVVLNACYSELQAQAIAKYIDCVIGMSKAIGDQAAINFSIAFYQALGYGRDIKTAFELGCGLIDLQRLNEQDTPKLLAINKNPQEIVFVHKEEQR